MQLIVIILILIIHSFSWAACGGSSPNLTAASASYNDVNDCFTAATYGDTINIPAGDVTWTSRIQFVKDVRIVGAGSGTSGTKITINITNPGYTYYAPFEFTPDATAIGNIDSLTDTNTFEVSGIWFVFNDLTYITAVNITNTSNTTPIRRVKIHDCKFTDADEAGGPSRFAIKTNGLVYGVFYSNTLSNLTMDYHEGKGENSFLNGRASLGDGRGMYYEDNNITFTGSATFGNYVLNGANNNGGVAVFRYNVSDGSISGGGDYMDIHGNQGTGTYAGQQIEVYGNNLTTANGQFEVRGGKFIAAFNKWAASAVLIREEFSDTASSTLLSGGGALNSCAENQGVSRQTCAVDSSAADTCICQKVHSTYLVNNRNAAGTIQNATINTSETACPNGTTNPYDCESQATQTINSPLELVENTEFFNHNASFDGTAGVGCGVIGSRPATCTAGVGYFATTQDCTQNVAANIGNNPSTPISGTLYKCVSTNTWAALWTPYTYPHPLRGQFGTVSIGAGGTITFGAGGTITLQ